MTYEIVENGKAISEHKHEWRYYDGALGYESHKCAICGIDANDLKDGLTLEQLADLHLTPEEQARYDRQMRVRTAFVIKLAKMYGVDIDALERQSKGTDDTSLPS
jgi:hypothetical protein